MKRSEIVTKIASIGLAAALLLTACGGKDTGAAGSASSNSGAATAEAKTFSAEATALAEELIGRYPTENDNITEEVIEATIAKLKETYKFETLPDLKLASGDWVYISDNKGWFKQLLGDNGTTVSLVEGTVGNEVQLMERDELHLTNRMLYPYLLYKAQGGDLTAVALSADPNADIVSILVNSKSEIQSFEDLKGKTIGSWKAGCQYVALLENAKDLGWTEGVDYTYSNISNDNLKTALQAGEIDAISTHPFTNVNSEIINGNFREIATAKPDGVYTNYGGASVTFTSNTFAAEHENILKAVLKLRELVNAYIILNKEDVCKLLETITRDPAENNLFYLERRNETYFSASDPLEKLIDDTDNYQNWLIENIEEFSEENRIDRSAFFNEKFFK